MKRVFLPVVVSLAILSTGCASVKYGDKGIEAELRSFQTVPGKVSLYVCREQAFLVAAGVKSVVFVDNEAIGTVKPNMFVHTLLEPGKHGVLLRHDGLASGSGGFETFEAKANELVFYWVGVTGKGFGVLTVDHFDSETDAKKCVMGAAYSIKQINPSDVLATSAA